ncbi:hypothetical protein VTJ04DRAFT_10066 [Mycothermus thermophilus]|uniref:uncharacterized protein n=1 Tax=Humicola insolens TaxID=85995 RepID=UPI003742EDC2
MSSGALCSQSRSRTSSQLFFPGPRSHSLESRSIPTVKTFSNLLNSVHHPFAGARCSASPGGAADSVQTE